MVIDFHTHMFPDKIADKTITFLAEVCQIPPQTDGTYTDRKSVGRERVF